MSKALRVVGTIAGAVALIATGIGAAGGLGIMSTTTAARLPTRRGNVKSGRSL